MEVKQLHENIINNIISLDVCNKTLNNFLIQIKCFATNQLLHNVLKTTFKVAIISYIFPPP